MNKKLRHIYNEEVSRTSRTSSFELIIKIENGKDLFKIH